MVPPQASPAFQAILSSTPNCSTLGLPEDSTSAASAITSPSTQPPETEPEEIPLPVDGELAADGLRGRAPGLNDGGKRHAPALGTPGQCPWNDAWVARAHGFC